MFEYAKMKADLEQIECPVHAKTATIVFADGRMMIENVCCEEHRKKLEAALPDIDKQNVKDILAEMY